MRPSGLIGCFLSPFPPFIDGYDQNENPELSFLIFHLSIISQERLCHDCHDFLFFYLPFASVFFYLFAEHFASPSSCLIDFFSCLGMGTRCSPISPFSLCSWSCTSGIEPRAFWSVLHESHRSRWYFFLRRPVSSDTHTSLSNLKRPMEIRAWIMRAERRCRLFFHHLQKSASYSFHSLGAVAAASNRVSLHRLLFFFIPFCLFQFRYLMTGYFLPSFLLILCISLSCRTKEKKTFLAFFTAFVSLPSFSTLEGKGGKFCLLLLCFLPWRESLHHHPVRV